MKKNTFVLLTGKSMKPEIRDDQTIAEVQETFHYFFPFLKIDFFEKDFHWPARKKLPRTIENKSRLLGEFRLDKADGGEMFLSDNLKVKELEQYINSSYGLTAQVFRKSGNIWLETSVTNSWTLAEQNRQGEMLEMQYKL